jgi:DnaJ-class molecular chaperone
MKANTGYSNLCEVCKGAKYLHGEPCGRCDGTGSVEFVSDPVSRYEAIEFLEQLKKELRGDDKDGKTS